MRHTVMHLSIRAKTLSFEVESVASQHVTTAMSAMAAAIGPFNPAASAVRQQAAHAVCLQWEGVVLTAPRRLADTFELQHE